MATKFPERLESKEAELLIKEWELSGGEYRKESYYIGFMGESKWEAFYLPISPDSDYWQLAGLRLGEKHGKEVERFAWVAHHLAETKPEHGVMDGAFGFFALGELDYRLEECLQDSTVEIGHAEYLTDITEENVSEVLRETVKSFYKALMSYNEG